MEHYFTNNENLKSELRKLYYNYKNHTFSFFSDNGVFAKDKIDYASRVLLEAFLQEHECDTKTTILDVGCGYGFIGIVISKILNYQLYSIDINKRALHLCERNIKENKVLGHAYESNAYENVTGDYDYIITNPPIRAGKETVLNILKNAKEHLKKGGELWFVINKDQGAKSIKKILDTEYDIEIITKSKGFYVFKAKLD